MSRLVSWCVQQLRSLATSYPRQAMRPFRTAQHSCMRPAGQRSGRHWYYQAALIMQASLLRATNLRGLHCTLIPTAQTHSCAKVGSYLLYIDLSLIKV